MSSISSRDIFSTEVHLEIVNTPKLLHRYNNITVKCKSTHLVEIKDKTTVRIMRGDLFTVCRSVSGFIGIRVKTLDEGKIVLCSISKELFTFNTKDKN